MRTRVKRCDFFLNRFHRKLWDKMAPKVDVKELECNSEKMSTTKNDSNVENNKDCACGKIAKVPVKEENSRPKYRSMSACDVNLNPHKERKPTLVNKLETETPPTSLSNLKEKRHKGKRGSTPHIDRLGKEKEEKHTSAYSKLMYLWKKFHKSFSSKFYSILYFTVSCCGVLKQHCYPLASVECNNKAYTVTTLR